MKIPLQILSLNKKWALDNVNCYNKSLASMGYYFSFVSVVFKLHSREFWGSYETCRTSQWGFWYQQTNISDSLCCPMLIFSCYVQPCRVHAGQDWDQTQVWPGLCVDPGLCLRILCNPHGVQVEKTPSNRHGVLGGLWIMDSFSYVLKKLYSKCKFKIYWNY